MSIEMMCTLEITKVNQQNEKFATRLYPSSTISHLSPVEVY